MRRCRLKACQLHHCRRHTALAAHPACRQQSATDQAPSKHKPDKGLRCQCCCSACSHLRELEICRATWQESIEGKLEEQRRAIAEAEAASQASLAARQVLLCRCWATAL